MQTWLAEQASFLILAGASLAAFGLQSWWLRKTRSTHLPWLVWFLALALLLAGGILAAQAGRQAKERIAKITFDFARFYAHEVEQRGHWQLPDNVAANDPTYLRLIEAEKNWEALNPEISDIYTLRKRPDGKNIFIVDSETDYNRNGKYDGEREQRTRVGEVYDTADAGLERAFRGQANFDFVPIADRWGTWVSAFVPLHGPAGKLDGVLGVDFDARAFAATIADARFRMIGLVAVALVLLLGLSTLNAVLHAEAATRERARESLQLLGAAVEQSKESIIITDAQLDLPGPKIQFVNPAFTAMTGYPAAEALGKTPRMLQGPRTDKAVTERLRQCLEKGEVFAGETINYRKDGTAYFVEWQVAPVRDAGGKTTHFMAIQRDITARKQAEEQLAADEALLRQFIRHTPAAIAMLDTQMRYLQASERWIRDYHLTGRDIIGQSHYDIFPDVPQRWKDIHQRVLAGAVEHCDEDPFPRADGTTEWLQWEARPWHKAGGEVGGLIFFTQVITERKRAEAELAYERDLLRSLLDHSPDLIYFKDAQSRLIKCSQAAMKNYGAQDMAEVIGRTDFDFFTKEHAQAAFDDEQEIIRTGQPVIGKVEKETRFDGLEVWVSTTKMPLRDRDGQIVGTLGISRDITESRRAENLVRQSEERYRSLIDNARDAIFTIAPDGTFTSLNPAVEAIAKISRADWLGKSFAPMVHPDDLPRALEMFARVLKGEPVPVHELRGHPGLPRPALMEMTLSAQKDEHGKIIGVLGVGRDITKRKRLEAQLFQSQKMETVGKLAGGIAHEFNSIMTAIIGQSEFLAADLPPGNPLRHNATEIRKAADRAASLTRQLLAYGRKQLLRPEILDLNAVLSGMENVLHHLVGRNVDVRLVLSAGLPPVPADAGQIEQVIVNVVMNAVDAMPNGGKLTLETAPATLDAEYVSRFPELKAGDYVLLAISDTGTGMSDEVKARVFEPFFSTKDVGKGTGLGLATCYGILKQSGGHITVYSEPGRGSTFKIYLPQARITPRAPAPHPASAGMPRGIETILLVEDDAALREMAAMLLGRLGYHVLTAVNGLEALKLTQQPGNGHIDLLFTDVVMPHMSGKELANRIRSLFPQTKILFTSAYTEGAIVHQGALDPGVAMLQKPFTPAALATKVREILNAENPAA